MLDRGEIEDAEYEMRPGKTYAQDSEIIIIKRDSYRAAAFAAGQKSCVLDVPPANELVSNIGYRRLLKPRLSGGLGSRADTGAAEKPEKYRTVVINDIRLIESKTFTTPNPTPAVSLCNGCLRKRLTEQIN